MAAQPITVSDHAPTEIPQAAIAPLPPDGWEPLSIREARRQIAAWEAGGRYDPPSLVLPYPEGPWRDADDPAVWHVPPTRAECSGHWVIRGEWSSIEHDGPCSFCDAPAGEPVERADEVR